MPAIVPLVIVSGTIIGAEILSPTIAPLATNVPSAAPELVATMVREALTSDVPVIIFDISFPARPQVKALFIVIDFS